MSVSPRRASAPRRRAAVANSRWHCWRRERAAFSSRLPARPALARRVRAQLPHACAPAWRLAHRSGGRELFVFAGTPVVKRARSAPARQRVRPAAARAMFQQGFPSGQVPDWLQQPPPMLGSGGAPFAPPVAPTMAQAPLPSSAAGVSVLQAHSRHIWVGNLVGSITEAELHTQFSRFGPVDGISTYPGRNYAFVNMKARRGAARLCPLGLPREARRSDLIVAADLLFQRRLSPAPSLRSARWRARP